MSKEDKYKERKEYYESLDKRTKEFKDYAKWKANFDKKNSIGLGDAVEKVTKAAGIKKVVEFVKGEDCGCDKRKEKLNRLHRFTIHECPTEQEYNFMHEWFNRPQSERTKMTAEEQKTMNRILSRTMRRKLTFKNCCISGRINDMENLYKAYQ